MASLLHQFPAMNVSFSSHRIITNNLLYPQYYCCISSSHLRCRLAIEKPKCGGSEIGNNRGLDPELMPNHVALIMDGNRRWARSRGLSPQEGHKAGGEALKLIAPIFSNCGVKVLSVFAFSTENWTRPQEEVNYLMNLIEEIMKTNIEKEKESDGRIVFLGDRSQLSQSMQNRMCWLEERGKGKKGLQFAVCLSYSGRYDITEAARKIARKVENGVLEVEDIDKNVFEQHLETCILEFPNPDLVIRTSGELRVSNYMMWQMANTHLYFTKKMFPDLKEDDVVQALAEFQQRQKQEHS